MQHQQILTLYYKGYSGLSSLHGPLCELRRTFFEGGRAKIRRTLQEDGAQVRVRGKATQRVFRWERHRDRYLAEQGGPTPDGYALRQYEESGALCSLTRYDRQQQWLGAEYYGAGGQIAAQLLCVSQNLDELVWICGEQRGTLLACPVRLGTTEQAMIDSDAGEPRILAARTDGDFCYCTQDEYSRRMELHEQLRSGAIPPEPVFVPQPAPQPAPQEKQSETVQSERVQPETEPEEDRPQPAESIQTESGGVGELLRQIEQMRQRLRPASQNPDEKSAEKKVVQAPGAEPAAAAAQEKPPTRYGVAKCGADGWISAPGLTACRWGQAAPQNGEAAEDPAVLFPQAAKRITLSRTEYYRYFGELTDGLRSGRGRTEMPDGKTAYEGGYSRDARDGFGVYYYKTGRLCYAGQWRQNRRQGVGVGLHDAGGGLYAGTWSADRPNGSGAVLCPQGTVRYAGPMKNGLRDGVGAQMLGQGGALLVGRWKNDRLHGDVTVFDSDGAMVYTGGWKDGARHGMGTEYLPDGQLAFYGEWNSGSRVWGIRYQNGRPAGALTAQKTLERKKTENCNNS